MQSPPAVLEDDFEDRFGLLAVVIGPERDDAPARGGRLIELKLSNREHVPAVLVPSWCVEKQIADGEESKPGELRRPLRPDAGEPAQGSFERRRGGARRWHRRVIGQGVRRWEACCVLRVPY